MLSSFNSEISKHSLRCKISPKSWAFGVTESCDLMGPFRTETIIVQPDLKLPI